PPAPATPPPPPPPPPAGGEAPAVTAPSAPQLLGHVLSGLAYLWTVAPAVAGLRQLRQRPSWEQVVVAVGLAGEALTRLGEVLEAVRRAVVWLGSDEYKCLPGWARGMVGGGVMLSV